MSGEPLAGWVPMRVHWEQGNGTVDWCHLGGARFTAPFFDETLGQRLRHPFPLLFRRQTPLAALTDLRERQPGLPPTGFIFHLSRCGSTLVAQMLAALPANVVISEAAPLDAVLRAHQWDARATEDQRIEWVRGMVSALGQRWGGGETRYFLKLDAWHILDYSLLRRAFPDVPCVFLYRDPVEVLVSHARRPSWMMAAMNAPWLLGLDVPGAARLSREEYAARVLARFYRAALDHFSGPRLMNYRQLPDAVGSLLPALFGVELTAGEWERLRAASRLDAKRPSVPFADDAAEKQREATPEVRELAERWLNPWYEKLEARRRGREAA